MDSSNWAAEHLQVIRTLMERAAVYRRALAPIMIVVGAIGLAAATVPCFVAITTPRAFALYWMGVASVAAVAALLLVRRQALKAEEPFWSPPTRRVTQALLPAFFVGLAAGGWFVAAALPASAWFLAAVWLLSYGCGIHAAGSFMPRGIKLLGWLFVLFGCGIIYAGIVWPGLRSTEAAHYVMGTFFGLAHLAYGIYLYFTEKSRTVA